MTRVAPVTGPDDRFFWEGVERGKLLLQYCAECGRLRHPPRPRCPECGSLRWETRPARGTGKVYSYIVPRHPPPAGEDPPVVVLVELDEGARLISNLRDVAKDDVRNDMAVEVFFEEVEPGVRLPQFRPAAGAST